MLEFCANVFEEIILLSVLMFLGFFSFWNEGKVMSVSVVSNAIYLLFLFQILQ